MTGHLSIGQHKSFLLNKVYNETWNRHRVELINQPNMYVLLILKWVKSLIKMWMINTEFDLMQLPKFSEVMIEMICEWFYWSIQFFFAHVTALVIFKQRMVARLTCFTQGIASFKPTIYDTFCCAFCHPNSSEIPLEVPPPFSSCVDTFNGSEIWGKENQFKFWKCTSVMNHNFSPAAKQQVIAWFRFMLMH